MQNNRQDLVPWIINSCGSQEANFSQDYDAKVAVDRVAELQAGAWSGQHCVESICS